MRQSDVPLQRYALSVLKLVLRHSPFFWALLWLFYVYWMYHCQNTWKHVASPPLKLVRHSLLFSEHFDGYFKSIVCTVAKIQAKTFRQLWNRFYGIYRFFLSTSVVILHQSYVHLPRYAQKRCFAGFETGFTAFSVNFWALRWLFCVNFTCRCKDTGEDVASPSLKPVLRHSLFIFEHFCR